MATTKCSVCGMSKTTANKIPPFAGRGLGSCNQCPDRPVFCVRCGLRHLAECHKDSVDAQRAIDEADRVQERMRNLAKLMNQ